MYGGKEWLVGYVQWTPAPSTPEAPPVVHLKHPLTSYCFIYCTAIPKLRHQAPPRLQDILLSTAVRGHAPCRNEHALQNDDVARGLPKEEAVRIQGRAEGPMDAWFLRIGGVGEDGVR